MYHSQLISSGGTIPQIRKKNTLKSYEFVLSRFTEQFGDRPIVSMSSEECLAFLSSITDGKRQATKRNRYAVLTSLFNFIKNAFLPDLQNPCITPIFKSLFRQPKLIIWRILEKDTVDEIIFRTMNIRNRLILELMARGGMRIGEVLNLRAVDVQGQKLSLRAPKSGREGEVAYLPNKISDKLQKYIDAGKIEAEERVFAISYVTAWHVVRKAGLLVGIKLSPHDLRRHAATYASRAGTPIEIVSKIILRHSNLSTTQRYLGKVSDQEAMRWIDNLHG